MMAILEAPNNQSFVAQRAGPLLDATVKSIDAQGVVFVEQMSRPRHRPQEIRKTLRPAGEDIR